MTKILTVILCLITPRIFAQKGWGCDYTKNDSLKELVGNIVKLPLPNLLCVDDQIPFLTWKEKPEQVTFNLYDRWGHEVLCYDKPDMMITADERRKYRIKEDNVYYFTVVVITKAGKEIRFCGQLPYHGYCRCG